MVIIIIIVIIIINTIILIIIIIILLIFIIMISCPPRRLASLPRASQSYMSKGIWRQGKGPFVGNSYVSTLCPVGICPYLCTSEFPPRGLTLLRRHSSGIRNQILSGHWLARACHCIRSRIVSAVHARFWPTGIYIYIYIYIYAHTSRQASFSHLLVWNMGVRIRVVENPRWDWSNWTEAVATMVTATLDNPR